MDEEIISEVRILADQAGSLAVELHDISDRLRGVAAYRRARFWSALMAAMAVNIGLVLLIGGQSRVSASAYTLVAAIGPGVWGSAFIACGLLVAVCAWKCHRKLKWALMIEAIPYVGLALSFVLAALRYPDANLTAAPVYTWIAVCHGFLADFARREFGEARHSACPTSSTAS